MGLFFWGGRFYFLGRRCSVTVHLFCHKLLYYQELPAIIEINKILLHPQWYHENSLTSNVSVMLPQYTVHCTCITFNYMKPKSGQYSIERRVDGVRVLAGGNTQHFDMLYIKRFNFYQRKMKVQTYGGKSQIAVPNTDFLKA